MKRHATVCMPPVSLGRHSPLLTHLEIGKVDEGGKQPARQVPAGRGHVSGSETGCRALGYVGNPGACEEEELQQMDVVRAGCRVSLQCKHTRSHTGCHSGPSNIDGCHAQLSPTAGMLARNGDGPSPPGQLADQR